MEWKRLSNVANHLAMPNGQLHPMVLMVGKQPLITMEWQWILKTHLLDSVAWQWFRLGAYHCPKTFCLLPKHRSGLQLGNICIDHYWLFVLFILTKGKELWISYTLVGSTIAAIPATALVKENYNRSDADKELNKSDSWIANKCRPHINENGQRFYWQNHCEGVGGRNSCPWAQISYTTKIKWFRLHFHPKGPPVSISGPVLEKYREAGRVWVGCWNIRSGIFRYLFYSWVFPGNAGYSGYFWLYMILSLFFEVWVSQMLRFFSKNWGIFLKIEKSSKKVNILRAGWP